MYLKSITMKGFKSFPERTRLEFGPGTSVIVGPNGSGKSNVTDAVLWALGEQSPMAVRGHSMQDVIFGGAPGRQAAGSATVELVLDDSEGLLGLGPEVSIARRLERNGEGEYRIGGARCRLIDVIEVLSDTGLGKEMHSVISQGRVEAIVTSKPRDRRLLIEEAAGLGKHRKRRRRAQLKLGHTQDNLDRALDVEREARSRLKPLKRQAEAAELHERLHRQTLEVRWELARDELRARRAELEAASEQALEARAQRTAVARELEAVSERRRAAEEALAARSSQREELSRRSYGAQSAADKVGFRAETIGDAALAVAGRVEQARTQLAQLSAAAAADQPDTQAHGRIDVLSRELEALQRDREAELARQLAELEKELAAAAALELERAGAVEAAKQAREQAEATYQEARGAVREAERVAEAARRDSASVGGELAAVNQFLRSHQGAPGGARSLADELTVAPGDEHAAAALLDGRLSAALAASLPEALELLERLGSNGGRVLLPGGAERAGELVSKLRVVDDLRDVDESTAEIAVTRDGRAYDPRSGELWRAPAVGEERVLSERNRRDELIAASERALQAEQAARTAVEAAGAQLAVAEAARERAIAAHRSAVDGFDDAAEQQRRLAATIQRRRTAPDEGPGADRRAQIEAELSSQRSQLDRAERERAQREGLIRRVRAEIARDEQLAPQITAIQEQLKELAGAIAECKAAFDAELARDREAGETVAAELRACAQEEAAIQTRLHAAGEELTSAEVSSQRSRDRQADAEQALQALAAELELEPAPAPEPLAQERREELRTRLERLARRREQLGPVNPLAQDEYAEALAHVEELETQRNDLETALRELEGLIRDTDRQIRETFEETFEAAARNFEELAARVFPGGSGRLRLVSESIPPSNPSSRAGVIGGQTVDSAGGEGDDDTHDPEEITDEEDLLGVEIEITPAGKAMKRLTLLSGGEKSMTALAFLFAVFLARPCPFYILDEVEAALDDLNISRFLDLLDTYNDRAQFIVVTHQKRTMEAADSLYGVSMGGDGISKVISRRLPEREAVA